MTIRSLPLRHVAKLVSKARVGEDGDPDKLGPGQMRLFSFYRPSLTAGDYTIEVQQEITATVRDGSSVHKQHMVVKNTRDTPVAGSEALQEFEVVVPRFSLDPSLINSYYPPDGHQDEGRILPHIVLNDPHYPWEIPAGVTQNMDGIIDNGRSVVPWVALIVFDPEDLRIPTIQDIQALGIQGITDVSKQSNDGTFKMPVNQYFANTPEASRINYQAGYKNDLEGYNEITSLTDPVNIIFPAKELVNSIFSSTQDVSDHKYGVEAFKYLAHVRQINTVGFPDAGVEEEGLFSTIISARTGAFDITQGKTQICHLVSIEHMDATLGDWIATPTGGPDRIGLVSLFSWLYTALPPNPVNFVDTMTNLTDYQQMLHISDDKLATLEKVANSAAGTDAMKALSKRLRMGYTITRWRPETGEETVAFNRGPLVPQRVTWPPAVDIPSSSSTSKEYQILDPTTGVMDLSYSSAWQAGKLLAISDTVFSAALMRFRSAVYNSSAYKTRMALNGMETKQVLMSKVATSISTLQSQSTGNTSVPTRVISQRDRAVLPALKSSDALPVFQSHLNAAVVSGSSAGQDIYNEFNLDKPNNSDWVVIFTWLCNKLSLGDIPPQYLIPEPSYLPRESLRFFHIDDFWLDCLIDGALSVANHLDHDDDRVRTAIKQTFNVYLDTVVPEAGYKPQIPSYGFLIRSQLIKAMPDLRITVEWTNPDNRAPVCRWTKWDDQTLMCLLDREPEELSSITLAQPPHQQRFSLGSHLDTTSLTFDLRTLYTSGAPENASWPDKNIPDDKKSLPQSWFNWNTRCLQINEMAKDVNMLLQFGTATDVQNYIDPIPNSCELGLELNDPSYYFAIVPPLNSNPNVPARNRQLYIQGETPAPTPTAAAALTLPPTSAPNPSPPASVPVSQPVLAVSKLATVQPVPVQPKAIPAPPPNSQSTQIKPPRNQPRISPNPPLSLSVTSLISHTVTAAATTAATATASTLTPHYTLLLYPDYKGPPTRFTQPLIYTPTDYLPTLNAYFYDLIFSIRKKPTLADSTYKLLSIRIDIPTTTSTSTSTSTTIAPALLTQDYDGPGLRMLSNQRFIPFLYNQSNTLYVEVVPRTASSNYSLEINDAKTTEMTFRFAEANIAAGAQGDTKTWVTIRQDGDTTGKNDKREQVSLVKVVMTEVYSTPANPQGEGVQSTYFVVKRDVGDDGF